MAAGRVGLTVADARNLAEGALRGIGYRDDEARIIADHVIDAALCGYEYSGLAKILNIPDSEHFRQPRRPIIPFARRTSRSPSMAAKRGSVLFRAAKATIKKAAVPGIGWFGERAGRACALRLYLDYCETPRCDPPVGSSRLWPRLAATRRSRHQRRDCLPGARPSVLTGATPHYDRGGCCAAARRALPIRLCIGGRCAARCRIGATRAYAFGGYKARALRHMRRGAAGGNPRMFRPTRLSVLRLGLTFFAGRFRAERYRS